MSRDARNISQSLPETPDGTLIRQFSMISEEIKEGYPAPSLSFHLGDQRDCTAAMVEYST
jgi:hypothetical protein